MARSPTLAQVGRQPSTRTANGGLTERLHAGSQQAMAEIFAAHLDVIYNYCYRRSGSWSAAEDLASTVFLEVWKSRRRAVDIDGSVLPWLYGVATNVCRNYRRTQRRRSLAVARLQLADHAPATVEDEVVNQLEADRRLVRLLERLDELPRSDQDVFVLVCWEQLSYAETAQALGIPIGTVRSRLARVRRTLKLTDDQESLDV